MDINAMTNPEIYINLFNNAKDFLNKTKDINTVVYSVVMVSRNETPLLKSKSLEPKEDYKSSFYNSCDFHEDVEIQAIFQYDIRSNELIIRAQRNFNVW